MIIQYFGNGLLFRMIQPTRRSTTKSHHKLGKPTIRANENIMA